MKPLRETSSERTAGNCLAAWREDTSIRPVLAPGDRHVLHTYFNTYPESPDGRWVLVFTSREADAHRGQVRIVERETGVERVLADGVTVEDAHRQAYQQWTCGGRVVVFQHLRGERWQIVSVDVDTGADRVLCEGRHLGWGAPEGDFLPLHGPHWAPGEVVDLELLDVRTGAIETVLRAGEVCSAYPGWVGQRFGQRRVSIFFPVLSPDGSRVFFKMACATGNGFRHARGSERYGLVVYDLQNGRFLFQRDGWGHPAWHPNSRTILTTPCTLIDTDRGAETAVHGPPRFPGGHPSFAPDGRYFVTDTRAAPFGGDEEQWAVALAALRGTDVEILARSPTPGAGTTSWRPPHPHPVFSADGMRIYFNVNLGDWTAVYVAEQRTE